MAKLKHHIIRFTTKMGMTARPDERADANLIPTLVAEKNLPLAQRCDSYTFSIESPDGWVRHFSSSHGHEFDKNRAPKK